MQAPLTQAARDRLRAQLRREQELSARVLVAEARLADAIAKRDAVLSAQDDIVARRRDDVADALIAYVDDAGLGLERAAIVLGRSRSELRRIVRERRIAIAGRTASAS
jgi:hypothetical protein